VRVNLKKLIRAHTHKDINEEEEEAKLKHSLLLFHPHLHLLHA